MWTEKGGNLINEYIFVARTIVLVEVIFESWRFLEKSCSENKVKPLNSGHLRVVKNLPVIKRHPLLGGNLTKIVTFVTKHFVRCSRHVRYLGCQLLGGFIVCSKCRGEHSCRSVISVKLLCNFIEMTLWNGCSPLNLLHIFRTHFPKNTYGGLLLAIIDVWLSSRCTSELQHQQQREQLFWFD